MKRQTASIDKFYSKVPKHQEQEEAVPPKEWDPETIRWSRWSHLSAFKTMSRVRMQGSIQGSLRILRSLDDDDDDDRPEQNNIPTSQEKKVDAEEEEGSDSEEEKTKKINKKRKRQEPPKLSSKCR